MATELLLKLTTRLDPQPLLFDAYATALATMRAGAPLAAVLRRFEWQLLEFLGYGLDAGQDADAARAALEAALPHVARRICWRRSTSGRGSWARSLARS